MKKTVKGNYGYLKYKRKLVIFRTILLFALALSIFLIGYATTGSKQNLLTIVAVLGCLPACKSAVSVIIYARAKGCSQTAQETIAGLPGAMTGMYDMYFTSYKENFAISHMMIANKVILGYTESSKCDKKTCEDHLQNMLRQGALKNMTVSITDDLNKYGEQLRSLQSEEHTGNQEKEDEVRELLYEISL